ncbi:hypothetical protein Y10_16720 [Neptunitalea sp. Y10]|uniref:Transporter n=2 Tax=Neptunitalea lumnitzerae TaxID=2965509 RepID=A0ABQ5MIU4_9FLAO|nr:hypothetical protein Y10_16720 [Neptunitalea sp. Y10]
MYVSVHAQDVNTYIEKAIDNNPEIQKLELRYAISKEKVNEVAVLPNTEFGAGYFVSEPETRTGPQTFKLSAKQMFPWFGTITSKEDYQSSLADVAHQDVVIAKRKLIFKVAQSYYKLYSIKQKENVLTKQIELLNTYETLVLKSLEVNKATAVDALKIQMRKNELEGKQEQLKQNYTAELATFTELLNTEDMLVVSFPEESSIDKEQTPINIDSLQLHPELIKYDKMYESVVQSEIVNNKSKSAMIGVGVDYINVAERTDMNVLDNGKDIFMPMVSVSIPIFNASFKSKSKQHQLAQQEIELAKVERYNFLAARLKKSISDRKASLIKYKTQLKNIEQAKNAETILMSNYENGTLKYQDLLDVQELMLGFELNKVDATLDYHLQTTTINYLSTY